MNRTEDGKHLWSHTEIIARLEKEVGAEKRIWGKAIYQHKIKRLIPDQEKKEKPEETCDKKDGGDKTKQIFRKKMMKQETDGALGLRSFPSCIWVLSLQDLIFRNKCVFFLSSLRLSGWKQGGETLTIWVIHNCESEGLKGISSLVFGAWGKSPHCLV